jgi:hypothetical protein
MLWQLTALLPGRLGECSLGVAIGGAILGMAFWIAGARFSRSLITLIAVAIGTSVGIRLPGWLGWNFDGMVIGVGGALLLGVSGYLLHRTWIGMYLAVLLAIWAGVGSWIALNSAGTTHWPTIDWSAGFVAALQTMWAQTASEPTRSVAIAAGIGLAVGVLMSVFWPKLSSVTTWSLAGVTLVASMFAATMQTTHWHAAAALNASGMIQGAVLIGLVVLGASIQWLIIPRNRAVVHQPLAMDD